MGKKHKKPQFAKPNASGRNDTEQYFKLTYHMARSPAWRSLTGAECKVFLELRTRFHGSNNGRLSLSIDEGKRLLQLGKATIHRALAGLQRKGFIKKIKQGHWYGRMASEWAVTDKSLDGEPPTNDWKHWRPGENPILGPTAEHNDPQYVPSQNREP